MAKAVRVGEVVELASGVSFKVTFASAPAQPWHPVKMGAYWGCSGLASDLTPRCSAGVSRRP